MGAANQSRNKVKLQKGVTGSRNGVIKVSFEDLQLTETQREMIEAGGRFCQIMGLPRSMGQILGLLYLSVRPLSLNDMVQLLGISKASASNGARQLGATGAIRQVWVQGDRRDYFEVVENVGVVIKGFLGEFFKPRLVASNRRLASMLESLGSERQDGVITDEQFEVFERRIKQLCKLQTKIEELTPFAERML